MLTQRLLAHVPLLLHPPEKLAILGLGSGVTLGSALPTAGTCRLLEISPQVVEAARFFEDENHRALADPAHAAHRRRRADAPAAHARTLRRHRVRAVEPVDGRDRVALHTRVLPGRPGPPGAGRRALPMGAHLRHQHARPAVDRRDVCVRVSGRHPLAGGRRRRPAGGIERAARAAPGARGRRLAAVPAWRRTLPRSA